MNEPLLASTGKRKQLNMLGDIFRENSRKVITPTRYLP